jgi:general secretion pathway protein M
MLPASGRKWLGAVVFIGGHLAALAISYAVLLAPLQQLSRDAADELAERQFVLRRLQSVLAQEKAVTGFAKGVKDLNAQGELLDGSNEGIASANLQSLLQGIASTAGATVKSLRALPPRGTSAPMIGARIEIAGPLRAIHAVVHAIEGNRIIFVVTSAIIRPAQVGREVPGEEPKIDAQFDIYGGAFGKEKS